MPRSILFITLDSCRYDAFVVTLSGHNIIDGLKRSGYRAIGSGAVNWFNPARPTGRVLSADFESFAFAGAPKLKAQLE